jgi:ABC-type branched-subunit amino acid transport system ATPase component
VTSATSVGIVARRITAAGPLGAAFEAVDLEADPGDLVAVTGPAGSGRSSLLLALGGRLRLVAGQLSVGGHRLPAGSAAVRKLVAVARVRPSVDLDQRLRVQELIVERCVTAPRSTTGPKVTAALRLLGIDPPRDALLIDLHPAEQTLLACALAVATDPGALVIDAVDEGLEPGDVPWVWRAMHAVAGTGCTVVASACAPPPHPVPADVVVRLPHRSALERAAAARAKG